ncbi:MAG: sugar phosphate isomerase/epimerase family protein [Bacteroidia bacterium]|nr:sugar phosphate isomerase/epimerase family protein [Bacteroidia bacterium]
MNRRHFIRTLAAGTAAASLAPTAWASQPEPLFFRISLAQWSLHRALFARKLTTLEFPQTAREAYGIGAVEYVDTFFYRKVKKAGYIAELLRRSQDAGVYNHLIMIDTAGPLADASSAKRIQAAENHQRWIETAKALGCAAIRVNLKGDGSAAELRNRSADSLRLLAEFAAPLGISVLVENHGGYSSDAAWLASVMRQVNLPNCGTLPDFGNFCISGGWGSTEGKCDNAYDRYQGVDELMPFAKGVSAKSYRFAADGSEATMDYLRLLRIVKAAGYRGYIGVEYEGNALPEPEGIRATKALLEQAGASA